MVIILFILMGIFVWCEASSGATPLESLIPRRDLPKEWTLIHGPQIYNKKTLFEHINGQAELYLKYGFRQSVFAIYQDKKKVQNQIEVDIYDMGNVVQAFGVFSRFRNEDRPGGFGLDSYLDDHSASFYKGKYFVMAYATESNPDLMSQFSKLIALKISDPSPPPKEIGYFPKRGLKPGSIQHIPEGLLGHQFLNRGFQGTYMEEVEVKVKAEVNAKAKAEVNAKAEAEVKAKAEDRDKARAEAKEFHLFLAIFKNSQDAVSALRSYKDYLTKNGKIHLGVPGSFGSGVLKGEDRYKGQVFIVQKSFYLLGVVGFERERYTEDLLGDFVKSVK
jgi:hypothetical protein